MLGSIFCLLAQTSGFELSLSVISEFFCEVNEPGSRQGTETVAARRPQLSERSEFCGRRQR